MAPHDPHGRVARVDADERRRPAGGFRVADRARFLALVEQVVAALPTELRPHVRAAELVVDDVPDPDLPAHPEDGVRLASLTLPRPGGRARLIVHRRPLELRASTRVELVGEIHRAVAGAIREALGQPPYPD
ncbi:hypothetical protein [Euzebya sp.]|uniref:hypothetical protein n=1 Tax=Euzebya sp. TaxID=1971409 RepID=UPI003518287D